MSTNKNKRNKWISTFVEGEFYYYNGQKDFRFEKDDYVLVKNVTITDLNRKKDYNSFFGQVIFGNNHYEIGQIYMFKKDSFYRMQKIVEDEN